MRYVIKLGAFYVGQDDTLVSTQREARRFDSRLEADAAVAALVSALRPVKLTPRR